MQTLKPNLSAVAAKVIDGEAIIMNLTNGAYYSMTGVGCHIWSEIEQEKSRAAILDGIVSRYHVDAARATADLDALVAMLLKDDLIVEADSANEAAPITRTSGAETYDPPTLNKYTDMADMLALDPPMPSLSKSA